MSNQDKINTEYQKQINKHADKIVAKWLSGGEQREGIAGNASGHFDHREEEAKSVSAAIFDRHGIRTQLRIEDYGQPHSPWFTLVLVPSREKFNADAFDLKRDKEALNLRQAAAFVKQRVQDPSIPCVMLRSYSDSNTGPTWPPSEMEFAQDVAQEMTALGHPVEVKSERVGDEWRLHLVSIAAPARPAPDKTTI